MSGLGLGLRIEGVPEEEAQCLATEYLFCICSQLHLCCLLLSCVVCCVVLSFSATMKTSVAEPTGSASGEIDSEHRLRSNPNSNTNPES